MDIAQYFSVSDSGLSFSQRQASDFAKGVAGDFNPIHDMENKRFCVPGDLLFGALLHRYGCSSETSVQFAGMLSEDNPLSLPENLASDNGNTLHVQDSRGRDVLTFFSKGASVGDASFVSRLTEQYVRFSGQTFPDLLVPLMRDAGVMINPARPLVIYKDMSVRLSASSNEPLELSVTETDCHVTGKKGAVRLGFAITAGGKIIGEGEKNMVMSGLREFDAVAMQAVVDEYNQHKNAFGKLSHAV